MATLYICGNKDCIDNQNNITYPDEKRCDKCGSWRKPVMTKIKEMDRHSFLNGLKLQESEKER